MDRYLSFPPSPPPPSRRGIYPSFDPSSEPPTRASQTSSKTSYLSPSGGFQETQQADMTASNTAFTVFSGIGFFLAVVPLYWHLESWNVGTCMYMIWTALACLVHFVDSIVWSGNAINWAPAWCDICTFTTNPFGRFLSLTNQLYPAIRVQIAVMVAWPACALCIVRRLYYIASPAAVTTTRAEVRCRIIFGVAKYLLNGQPSLNRNVGR